MTARWPGPEGDEYALVFDRSRAARLLILPPLFDEANKTRHFLAETMRRLDGAGIDCFLPDLPGCNESLAPLENQTLSGWRAAATAAGKHFDATHVLTVRAGALIAPDLPGWRYAPQAGAGVLRAMLRARLIASREAGIDESYESLIEQGHAEGLELAGYHIGAALIRDLESPASSAGLTEIAQSDIGGGGLWLRAEPGFDAKQADALAAIVAAGLAASAKPARAKAGSDRPHQGERQRRHLTFPCGADTLAATLDQASGTTGLLLVSGGSEIRAGAFAGQARIAAQIAARGHPVLRYDRRGIGDSTGDDPGFRASAPDIAAAIAAFRQETPHVTRVVAFGNCDAASALMLAEGAGCDALVLANPWTFDDGDGASAAPPPAAIRARYAEKLTNPHELMRFATGKVSIHNLVGGLRQAFSPAPPPTGLAQEIAAGLARFEGPARILIAERDRTGQAFLAGWDGGDARLRRCAGASHAFVEPPAREWLLGQLLEALSG